MQIRRRPLHGEETEGETEMTLTEYQRAAAEFAEFAPDSIYPFLGLAEEAGEVCAKIAKFIRHNNGMTPQDAEKSSFPPMREEVTKFRTALMSELSDVMWMVAEIATLNGLSLDEIMEHNIVKLAERRSKGLIDGSGDTIEERMANR